ncbi:MAG: hypothetical protein HY376_02030 [Candidatus Blackburnbacteria bacterium]|nr:hypothetical protein [Candidatus Blackburnbacteria bacterium]
MKQPFTIGDRVRIHQQYLNVSPTFTHTTLGRIVQEHANTNEFEVIGVRKDKEDFWIYITPIRTGNVADYDFIIQNVPHSAHWFEKYNNPQKRKQKVQVEI